MFGPVFLAFFFLHLEVWREFSRLSRSLPCKSFNLIVVFRCVETGTAAEAEKRDEDAKKLARNHFLRELLRDTR